MSAKNRCVCVCVQNEATHTFERMKQRMECSEIRVRNDKWVGPVFRTLSNFLLSVDLCSLSNSCLARTDKSGRSEETSVT